MSYSSDPKDAAILAPTTRGRTTTRRILAACFGEWPLRGLDIVSDAHLDRTITLLPIESDPDYRALDAAQREIFLSERGGTATIFNNNKHWDASAEERIIWINMHLRNQTSTNLLHEAAHILQGDMSDSTQAGRLFGDLFRNYSGSNNQNLTAADRIINDILERDFDRIDRQLIRVGYLHEGKEIQARLIESLMAGYQQWGRLPLNRAELWAALESTGWLPPEGFRPEVERHPGYAEAQRDFSAKAVVPGWATRQLNEITNSFPTQEGSLELWREGLPALYSDFIEMLGDRHGRARMGFSTEGNPLLALMLFSKQHALYDQQDRATYYEKVGVIAQSLGTVASAAFIADYEQKIGSAAKEMDLMGAITETPGVADKLMDMATTEDWPNDKRDAVREIALRGDRVSKFIEHFGFRKGEARVLDAAALQELTDSFVQEYGFEAAKCGVSYAHSRFPKQFDYYLVHNRIYELAESQPGLSDEDPWRQIVRGEKTLAERPVARFASNLTSPEHV